MMHSYSTWIDSIASITHWLWLYYSVGLLFAAWISFPSIADVCSFVVGPAFYIYTCLDNSRVFWVLSFVCALTFTVCWMKLIMTCKHCKHLDNCLFESLHKQSIYMCRCILAARYMYMQFCKNKYTVCISAADKVLESKMYKWTQFD